MFAPKRYYYIFFLLLALLFSSCTLRYTRGFGRSDRDRRVVSQLFISGFEDLTINDSTQLKLLLEEFPVGGLIFRKEINITNKQQFLKLVESIIHITNKIPLFLSVDEEGGRVHFFEKKYGYRVTNCSAKEIGVSNSLFFAKNYYSNYVSIFKKHHLNFNFAPVVDIDLNKDNPIIGKLNRSYGDNVGSVVSNASVFIKLFDAASILTCLKHFPGHGSSLADTHKQFVDISKTYTNVELEPFKLLSVKSPSIMMGHLFNSNIDPLYPASLSKKTINDLLREKLLFDGLVVSDDIEMKALSDKYSEIEIVRLFINAGGDIILSGDAMLTIRSIKILSQLIKEDRDLKKKVYKSYKKIIKYKKKYNILK